MRKIISTEVDGKTLELYGSDDDDLELFCEGVHGIASTGASVKFNLHTVLPWESDSSTQKRRVVARIVIPAADFVSTAELLQRFADKIREPGAVVNGDEADESDEAASPADESDEG